MPDKITTDEMVKWLIRELTRYSALQITHPHLYQTPTEQDMALLDAIISRIRLEKLETSQSENELLRIELGHVTERANNFESAMDNLAKKLTETEQKLSQAEKEIHYYKTEGEHFKILFRRDEVFKQKLREWADVLQKEQGVLTGEFCSHVGDAVVDKIDELEKE